MSIRLSERELDVMAVLWDRGSGTVAEVRDALLDPLAYTTVLTVLRTLEEKGFITHLADGKAHRYLPAVTPDLAGRSALSRVLDKIFGGSKELLIAHLVRDRKLSPDEIRRLRRMLGEKLKEDEK